MDNFFNKSFSEISQEETDSFYESEKENNDENYIKNIDKLKKNKKNFRELLINIITKGPNSFVKDDIIEYKSKNVSLETVLDRYNKYFLTIKTMEEIQELLEQETKVLNKNLLEKKEKIKEITKGIIFKKPSENMAILEKIKKESTVSLEPLGEKLSSNKNITQIPTVKNNLSLIKHKSSTSLLTDVKIKEINNVIMIPDKIEIQKSESNTEDRIVNLKKARELCKSFSGKK